MLFSIVIFLEHFNIVETLRSYNLCSMDYIVDVSAGSDS